MILSYSKLQYRCFEFTVAIPLITSGMIASWQNNCIIMKPRCDATKHALIGNTS